MCLVRLLRPSPSNLSRAPGCTAGFAVCHDRIPSPRRWRRPTLPFLAPDDRRKLCSAAAAASADMPAVGPGPSFAPGAAAPAVVLKGTARRRAESAPAPRGARRVGARAAALWRPHPIPAPLLPSETPFLFKSPWPAPGAPSPATLTPPTPSRPTPPPSGPKFLSSARPNFPRLASASSLGPSAGRPAGLTTAAGSGEALLDRAAMAHRRPGRSEPPLRTRPSESKSPNRDFNRPPEPNRADRLADLNRCGVDRKGQSH